MVMRSFVNSKFAQKLEELAKNNMELIEGAKNYILAQIEFVNGYRAFVDLLTWKEGENTELKVIKRLFLKFSRWFL